jgi:hypothetical protein
MKAIKDNLSNMIAKANKIFKASEGIRRAANEQQRMADAAKVGQGGNSGVKGKQ